jgi:hypothetical protein
MTRQTSTAMSVTNIELWQENARSPPRISWLDRSELVAHFIRPGDIVCDLGAGAQTLRRFLPASVGYIPVDCVGEQPGTWIADFNGEFTLPDRPFNVITCIGLLAHLTNPAAFLQRLATTQAGKFIIFTTSRSDEVSSYSRFISDLSRAAVVRRRGVYTGIIGPSGPIDRSRRPISTIVCANAPLLAYAASRLGLLGALLKRGGNNG